MRRLTTTFLTGLFVAMSALFATNNVSYAQKPSGENEANELRLPVISKKATPKALRS